MTSRTALYSVFIAISAFSWISLAEAREDFNCFVTLTDRLDKAKKVSFEQLWDIEAGNGDRLLFANANTPSRVYRGVKTNSFPPKVALKAFFGVQYEHFFLQSHNYTRDFRKYLKFGFVVEDARTLARRNSILNIKKTFAESKSFEEFHSISVWETQRKHGTTDSVFTDSLFASENPTYARSYAGSLAETRIILQISTPKQTIWYGDMKTMELQILSDIDPEDLEGMFLSNPYVPRNFHDNKVGEYAYFRPIRQEGRVVGIERFDVLRFGRYDVEIDEATRTYFPVTSSEEIDKYDFFQTVKR